MDKSDVTRKIASKKALGTKAPKVNYDALQTGVALARQLNHDKPHWPMPVTGSGLACQLCQWDSKENIIAKVQVFILCNVNLCVKHFAIFHKGQTLVEEKEVIASLEKICRSWGTTLIIRPGKERVRNMFIVKAVKFMKASVQEF